MVDWIQTENLWVRTQYIVCANRKIDIEKMANECASRTLNFGKMPKKCEIDGKSAHFKI